ncbi:serine/threonine protein kinase [Fusarium verticillioides 7600]|uniref:Serine/threonine protein kinase n=1 Tax=Gibberella moniliformis (strain M3125 / FGSC 7600) TaxID=334819 RepID=W7LKD9_GIBM7|nr:serine/threonine protein kinase [Fusarium verticillioides 7600]EWG35894.1 serine/threonine protein kinase [Fusarium verticillioides 7600]
MPDFSDVFEKHWSFFPVEFKTHSTRQRELLSRQILPIKYCKSFREENSGFEAALHKVQIDPDYCDLVPKDTPLVFKIYKGYKMSEDYNLETENYSNLNGKAQHAITKCYGSFSCEETDFRVIILEYASEGSLRNFFRNIHPPVHAEEFQELWVNLVGLLDGLDALHTYHSSKQGRIHQDIKPDNILVFPNSAKSRFDARFKLTDFHVTEFKQLDREGKMTIDNWGSRLYSAPECYANFPAQFNVRPLVSPNIDLWALGAVFSEILVWSISGYTVLETFRKARQKEISTLTYIEARGIDACYHDGHERLPTVDRFLKDVLEHRRATDEVSPAISHMILNFMMTNERERLRAVEIKSLMQSITATVHQTNSSTYEAQVAKIRQSRLEESSSIIATSSDHIGLSDASSLRLWSDPEHTAGDTSLSTAPNTRDTGSGHKNQKGDPRIIEVYGYGSQPLHGDLETEDQKEIQSLASQDDHIDSLQSGITPLRVYQIASKLLVERFLDDDHLLDLYQQAVKRLDRTRFVNNHRILMKQYFLDLRATARSRAEEMSVDFLRSRKERIRISSVIYDLVLNQGEQVRRIFKMEIKDDQESILLVDRFLAAQEIYDHDRATGSDPESSDSSEDLSPEQEQTSQGEASKIEAVAIFMTAGSAFDSYKCHLDEFLHPKKLESDYREAIEPLMVSSEDCSTTPVDSQDATKTGVVDASVVKPETSPAAVETASPFVKQLVKGYSWLIKITRPRVKEGYRRLEWTCDCGSQLYADFLVLDEERFRRFAESLQSPPPKSSHEMIANAQSSQASSSRERESPVSNRDSPNINSHLLSSSSARPSGADTSSEAIPRSSSERGQRDHPAESPKSKAKYLALCIQTGTIYTTLEEAETSTFKLDAELLKEMKDVYTRIRGVRSKRNSLFIPIRLEYVKFMLWNKRQGYISITERPKSVPPEEDLQYDFAPLDAWPPMPDEVFFHYLEKGEEKCFQDRHWIPRLAVRRDNRIIEGHEASFGWGIHIIEGPNRWAIFALFLVTVFGSALAALLWSTIHNDIQGGTGLGQLIIALSSAILTASLFRLGYL